MNLTIINYDMANGRVLSEWVRVSELYICICLMFPPSARLIMWNRLI